jgi:hypothetical protein
MHRGYVALWRKFSDHEFWTERRIFSKAEAWIDILWSARHRQEQANVTIGMTIVECGYAQVVRSTREWGKRWSWSESKVRRFLGLCEKLFMIRLETVANVTRLTVLNYETYDPGRRKADAKMTQSRRKDDARSHNDQNDHDLTPPISPPQGERCAEKKSPESEPTKPEWRTSFDSYLADHDAALKALLSNQQWLEERQEFHPGLDIRKTCLKACVDYWRTKSGWAKKKAARKTQTIDWKGTYNNALTLKCNQVWLPRDTQQQPQQKPSMQRYRTGGVGHG